MKSATDIPAEEIADEPLNRKRKQMWYLISVVGMVLLIAFSILAHIIKKTKPLFTDNALVYHMIVHSHDDLGWIVSERDYSNLVVGRIVRTSADYVSKHPNGKFSFTNIGFLKHWIDQEAINNTALFKSAIDSGRMEILNGGYAVHDNAGVYFDDIITNYEYGREFVHSHFNYIPRTAWLIDPFGLSLTTSRLYAEMGYDQFVMNRIPNWERDNMRTSGQLHKYWVVDGKPEYSMFIAEMANHYQVEYPFDVDCSLGNPNNEFPIVNVLDPEFNLHTNFSQYMSNMAAYHSWFNAKHIMVPWGGDFYFRNFEFTFGFVEAILYFARSNSITGKFANNFIFKLSSAEEYFKLLKEESKGKKFEEKHGDFFPYIEHDLKQGLADPSHSSWTGYFVTNPHAKKVIRSFGEALRGLKNLLALYSLRGQKDDISIDEIVNQAEKYHWQVGINTHHDTITGTSTNYAAATYLQQNIEELSALNTTFNIFISKYFDVNVLASYQDLALLWPNGENLQIPTSNTTYLFISTGGVPTKMLRMNNDWKGILGWLINDHRPGEQLSFQTTCNANNSCEHVLIDQFKVAEGKMYLLRRTDDQAFTSKPLPEGEEIQETISGKNVNFKITAGRFYFNDGSNEVNFGLHQYIWDPQGLDSRSNHTNGKYIFSSAKGSTPITPDQGKSYYTVSNTRDSIDIHLVFLNGVINVNFKYVPAAPETHRYSVKLDSGILWENLVERDTNYVIRYYSSTIKNGKNFLTDSNGLELMARTFGIKFSTVDVNYYPLTRFISIQDSNSRLTVMIDRAQAGSSTDEGVIEVMFNRRSTTDDGKGANEHAFETEPISVLHYLIFDKVGSQDKQLFRAHQVESDNPIITFKVSSSRENRTEGYYLTLSDYGRNGVTGIDNPLIRVLFDRRTNGRLMIRIYNMDDKNSATMDLRKVLTNNYQVKFKSLIETGLDFNSKTADMNKWSYNWVTPSFPDMQEIDMLTLKPLQIRTFEIQV